jgi:CheY-like chemotaxis protein
LDGKVTDTAKEVLIVEDIPETVAGLTTELEYRGLIVHKAAARDGAERILRESKIHGVLVDLNIPSRTGGPPSPEEGHRLVSSLLGGELGKLNQGAFCVFITAQTVDPRSSDYRHHPQFAGAFSKIADSRWLISAMAQADLVEDVPQLEMGAEHVPVYARVQLVVTEVLMQTTAVVDLVDLNFDKIQYPLAKFPSVIRAQLDRGHLPLVLWARADVAATDELELDLTEFSLSDEQIDPDRNYEDVSWLRESTS